MLHAPTRPARLTLFALLLAALAFPLAAPAQTPDDKAKVEPPFREYKGVRIGMTVEEARKLLGTPTDKGDTQDFYSVSENESCQVYYDESKKVQAVSVTYVGGKSVPTARAVLGDDAEPKQDGSVHKLIRFPKAGYWVSYSRTSGDSPMTIIAIQRMP